MFTEDDNECHLLILVGKCVFKTNLVAVIVYHIYCPLCPLIYNLRPFGLFSIFFVIYYDVN